MHCEDWGGIASVALQRAETFPPDVEQNKGFLAAVFYLLMRLGES